ncbi:MAG: OmpA family protein [Clostridia bacterium]|nr:OmpA family protein [Clostridia bacterium]
MKKKNIFFAMMICLFTIMVGLTGCGGESLADETTGPTAVCYAIAPTANSQGLNMNSPLVQDMGYETILGYGYISVVTIDGNPELVAGNSYDIPEQYKNASKEKLKTDARSNTTNLMTFMKNEIANDAQVDYLEGMRLAARSLNSLDGYDSKTIVVLGTGLSTMGTLNFQNNLLSADAEEVVDLLEEKNEIPDFTGMTVVWQQMGDVAEPQKPLTQTQRVRLQEIWGGIVERGGGAFVYNDIMANPVDSETSFPEVDIVELPEETPVKFDKKILEKDESLLEEPVMLTEEQVSFVPDQANYLDEDAAMEIIKPIADYLAENKQITILLAGTTAGDEDNDYTLTLSQERADAVKTSLVALGINESRIITVGLGSTDPWHVSGAGYEGNIASGNRKVVLLDASSEQAKEIIF